MQLPVNLQRVNVATTTNATINTLSSFTMLSAPGAGIRYRAWGMAFGARGTNTGSLWQRMRDAAASSTANLGELTAAAKTGAWIFWPGGLPCADNGAITCDVLSEVALQTMVSYLWYTTEL